MTNKDQGGFFHAPKDYVPLGGSVDQRSLRDERPHSFDLYKEILTAFSTGLADGLQIKKIYVPAAGTDITPSEVFPQAETTYGDIDSASVQHCKRVDLLL